MDSRRRAKASGPLALIAVSLVLLILVVALKYGRHGLLSHNTTIIIADADQLLIQRDPAAANGKVVSAASVQQEAVIQRKLELLGQAKALKSSISLIDSKLQLIEKNLGKIDSLPALDRQGDDAQGDNAIGTRPKLSFPLHRHTPHNSNDTIFVSIASFRDSECAPMLQSMFAQAKSPELLYVGLVEQHGPRDPPCLPPGSMQCQLDEFCPTDHIRIRRISPQDAKGPTFGRYMAMLLYRGQKYFLMVDSHNYFIPFWDMVLVRMYKEAADLATVKGKLVLSHYPDQYNNISGFRYDRATTSYLCRAKYLPEFGYLRLDGMIVENQPRPMPQPWAAAGFLFASAALIEEVPFDPYLDFLFDGEEILYSVRMWTHGWDIFSPNRNVMFHSYLRNGSPKVWSEVADWAIRQAQSVKRVQTILRSVKKGTQTLLAEESTLSSRARSELRKYGLGSSRSLAEWNEFAGVDPVAYQLTKNRCILK